VTGAKWSGPHRRLAEKLKPDAVGTPCGFCGKLMLPNQELDLDHGPYGRYRVTHSHCNRSAGARKGQLIQLARRGQRRRRFIVPNEIALGIEISTDRQHTSIAVAGRAQDGRVVVELASYLEGTNHAGTVRDMVVSRKSRVLAIMLDPRSPAATLVDPLKALRVELTLADVHTMASAHGDFADQLKTGMLAIEPHPALTAAAKHAMTRPLSGAEALERRKPVVDTSPVVAAELAVWGVLHVVRHVPRIHAYVAPEDRRR
jgi:hypothetical protein